MNLRHPAQTRPATRAGGLLGGPGRLLLLQRVAARRGMLPSRCPSGQGRCPCSNNARGPQPHLLRSRPFNPGSSRASGGCGSARGSRVHVQVTGGQRRWQARARRGRQRGCWRRARRSMPRGGDDGPNGGGGAADDPTRPPARPSGMTSARTWIRIWPLAAPSTRRSLISRRRSRTEMTMMLATPTAPRPRNKVVRRQAAKT
jgi:hypothetical protein